MLQVLIIAKLKIWWYSIKLPFQKTLRFTNFKACKISFFLDCCRPFWSLPSMCGMRWRSSYKCRHRVMRHMKLQGDPWQEINGTFVVETKIVPYFFCFHLQQPCIIIYPCWHIPLYYSWFLHPQHKYDDFIALIRMVREWP
jgi:hypothetical protein